MALAPAHWASFTVGGGTPLLLNIAQLEKLFFPSLMCSMLTGIFIKRLKL
ncbi:coproporphyrinogen III oxidase, partial [Salmonella enterica subsp. enterica serovar Enteritidis str. 13183-1]